MEIPVTLFSGLSTKECADIFLSINTEQKPVHRSLVFDLYKVASNYIVDPAALRAGDLASELNERQDSPFLAYVNFPGAPKGKKGLALSTIVSALKPLVEEKGVFEQVGLTELSMQSQFLVNFFSVLRDAYGAEWESSSNVFRMAAGFVGALEFVKNKLVVHCNLTGDFTTAAIAAVVKMSPGSLIRRESIEGLQGRRAFSFVANALDDMFDPNDQKGTQDQGMSASLVSRSGNYLLGLIPPGTQGKVFFETYTLTSADQAVLQVAAREDGLKYAYNGLVSFLAGLGSLDKRQTGWAITEMYYSAFYIARAALCAEPRVIFHVPKGAGNGLYTVRVENRCG